jgi:phenylalanyl-tRNA synthetase beta chain
MPQRIYEYDMVFVVEKGVPKESYHLAAASADPKSNFNYIKSVVEGVAYLLGLDIEVTKKEHKSFIEGRCAGILLGKREIGFFGELHPEVLTNFGIEEPVTAMEIELQAK